jgi:hypothetical protein
MRPTLFLAGLLAAIFASLAEAQFTFDIDQANSNFSWSGTTSLGPLVGNPSQNFQIAGTAELGLTAGGNPVSGAQIHSSYAAVVPDLSGKIPNPFPFLPPLAIVDVNDLVLDVSSDPFAVAPAGTFTATVVLTALSGTMTITPLGSSPETTDLTGMQSDPELTDGTLVQVGSTLTLVVPVDSTFDFYDPSSGVNGTLHVVGTMVAHFACPAPASFCATSPNSVGPGALISASGSSSITANDLVLTAAGTPPGEFGIFFYGPQALQLPLGDGILCVGQGIRLPLVQSSGGAISYGLDHSLLPPGGAIGAGQTWLFQCWYRDPLGGPAGFNTSDGLSVFFCP